MARYRNNNRGFEVDAVRFNDVDNPPPGLTRWGDIEGGTSIRDGSAGFVLRDGLDPRVVEDRIHVHFGSWVITRISGRKETMFDETFQEHYVSV